MPPTKRNHVWAYDFVFDACADGKQLKCLKCLAIDVAGSIRSSRVIEVLARLVSIPNPRDPLYYETASTLPVDFHSVRRAFASAFAEAGVNVQHAMHLTAHSDPRVHARYVMSTSAMRMVPDAALRRLHAATPSAVPDRDDCPSSGLACAGAAA